MHIKSASILTLSNTPIKFKMACWEVSPYNNVNFDRLSDSLSLMLKVITCALTWHDRLPGYEKCIVLKFKGMQKKKAKRIEEKYDLL